MDRPRAARLLGVDPAAGPQALRAAFHRAVKQAHPDLPGGDAGQLRQVIEAHDYLRANPAPAEAPAEPRPPPPLSLEISPLVALSGGRRRWRTRDGRELFATLPAGLRAGDQVRIAGELISVTIASADGLAVLGDHLCLTVEAHPALLRGGGALGIETPLGRRMVRVSRDDAQRGQVRVPGEGLPPSGRRPRGDLLVRLVAAALDPVAESEAQTKRRRFVADWAA